jgi:thioredoxin reductase
MTYDVIIVGGGPAGLSAALVLGSARRRVLVCDAGNPRNAAALKSHNYLTRDGIPPREMLRLGREEVVRYGVDIRDATVASARGTDRAVQSPPAAFEITTDSGERFTSRKLLLATGVADVLPDAPGFREFYGRGVHHCPYCDGWEYRDRAIACYGHGNKSVGLAQTLRTWSPRVTACTDGRPIDEDCLRRSRTNEIALRTEPVARLEGEGGRVRRVVFESGPPLECDAVFFNTGQVQRSDLPRQLGCRYDDKGLVSTEDRQGTGVPGLFVIGDADDDVQFIVVAAAEGATAAVAINRQLQEEDQGDA